MQTTPPELTWPAPSRSRRLTPELTGSRPTAMDRFKLSAPLAALLALAAVVYLWSLSRNGYANQYYAAAVQAGTQSWKAFLFGSLDAANYITVDKPPASLWLMGLSSRLFGFSSFSLLLPQALEGIAAVALLYATVRRWFGRPAALLSGLILALTPVAAAMFRFDNPDALLVLLLIAAAYALTRALEDAATRWLGLSGIALGLAFLTKELEAFLVLPAFAVTYLVAAPAPLGRRVAQLSLAAVALVVSAGWWVALVEIWPASARPYIGDSTNNSMLSVIFGSNGLNRISGAGGGFGGGLAGAAGPLRLLDSQLGGQVGWLLPAAAIALVAGVAWTARRPRTDRTRAAVLLWGGWLVISAAVYSVMTGVMHPYYTNTLAPAIAATVGIAATVLWGRREHLLARATLACMVAATAAWSYVLLNRTPDWHPWLRAAILATGLVAAGAILADRGRLRPAARNTLAVAALAAALAGPAAYTESTVARPATGANPTGGPALAASGGFPGTGRPAAQIPSAFRSRLAGGASGSGSASRSLTQKLEQDASRYTWVAATSDAQTGASLQLATGKPVMAIGGFSGADPAISLARFKQLVADGKIHYYVASGFGGRFAGASGGRFDGAFGGRFDGASGGRFNGASGGRFDGASGGRFAGGTLGDRGESVARAIQSWVVAHFKPTTVGAVTVYDLTQPTS